MSSDNSVSRPNKNAPSNSRESVQNLPLGWAEDGHFSFIHESSSTRVSIRRVASDDPGHRHDERWHVDIMRPEMDAILHIAPKQISLDAARAAAADYMNHHPGGELPEVVWTPWQGRVPLEEVEGDV